MIENLSFQSFRAGSEIIMQETKVLFNSLARAQRVYDWVSAPSNSEGVLYVGQLFMGNRITRRKYADE